MGSHQVGENEICIKNNHDLKQDIYNDYLKKIEIRKIKI